MLAATPTKFTSTYLLFFFAHFNYQFQRVTVAAKSSTLQLAMAPHNDGAVVEGITVELENQLPDAEKSISYDPALASAADTQQLGAFILWGNMMPIVRCCAIREAI